MPCILSLSQMFVILPWDSTLRGAEEANQNRPLELVCLCTQDLIFLLLLLHTGSYGQFIQDRQRKRVSISLPGLWDKRTLGCLEMINMEFEMNPLFPGLGI